MPGLFNAHTHAAMTLLRGLGSDLPLQTWLFDYMFPTEDRLRDKDIRTGSELALLEMLSTGTVSFSDMYYVSWETAEACGRAGIKANLARAVQSFDPDENLADSYRIRESMDFFKNHNRAFDDLVRVDFSLHAEYTCTDKVVRYYSDLCSGLDGCMHIHLSETASEHAQCIEKYGKTPAAWFRDLGAFRNPALAAHCVWVSEEDIGILKDCGVTAVHNPSSNMKLGSGFAPVVKLLDAGVNLALGTDGAASNNNLNMFEEMHLASVIHNGRLCDPTVMKPETVLKMATVNGARAQNRTDTGELTVGKKADIIAIDTDRPHLVPNTNPLALLCYSAQGSDVCMTMVNGKILYENGEFLTLDKEKIFYEANESIKYLGI